MDGTTMMAERSRSTTDCRASPWSPQNQCACTARYTLPRWICWSAHTERFRQGLLGKAVLLEDATCPVCGGRGTLPPARPLLWSGGRLRPETLRRLRRVLSVSASAGERNRALLPETYVPYRADPHSGLLFKIASMLDYRSDVAELSSGS